MSIWNGIKSAFGFSHDDEDDGIEDFNPKPPTYAAMPAVEVAPQPAPVSAPAKEPAAKPSSEKPAEPAKAAAKPASTASLPEDLFDSVIEVFNAAQPEFVRKCLSVEAERKVLIDSISDKLKARATESATKSPEVVELESKCEKLAAELKKHDSDAKTIENLREQNRKLSLSVERQKRAMLDRINDLEAQVANLNSEKDKFYTSGARKGNHQPAAPVDTKELDEAKAKVTELETELARQTTLREQLETKSRMSDEMLTDLRNKAAEARQELEKVTADLNEAKEELEHTTTERDEAIDLINNQLSGFEQLKEKLEKRILDLQAALKEERAKDKTAEVAELKELNASLSTTIENNLYSQANKEKAYQEEIATLKEEINQLRKAKAEAEKKAVPEFAKPEEPEQPQPVAKRRGRPRKVKIDSEVGSMDWFGGDGASDPDFGYHEPPTPPKNDNPAQLSLF